METIKPNPVSDRLFYLWRLAATGLSFAVFGIGGAVMSMLLAGVYLTPLNTAKKQRHSRDIISSLFRLYICMLKWLGLLSYEIKDLERLKGRGQLIIANHPSLLDVVFLISFIKAANCVVKGKLLNNPFTIGPVTAAGYLRNDDKDLIDRGVKSLQRGACLIIFPEGTRSEPNQPFKLLRGAANIALAAQMDMTPIIITCKPATLLKKEKWYTIPQSPPHYVFTVLADIGIAAFQHLPRHKAARRLTDHVHQLFMHHCGYSAPSSPRNRRTTAFQRYSSAHVQK